MFTWLNKQGVESDQGFIVQVINRYKVEYIEGSNKVTIPVDFGFSNSMNPCVTLKKSSVQCWDNGKILADKKRSEILKNFSDAMEFQEMKVTFE